METKTAPSAGAQSPVTPRVKGFRDSLEKTELVMQDPHDEVRSRLGYKPLSSTPVKVTVYDPNSLENHNHVMGHLKR